MTLKLALGDSGPLSPWLVGVSGAETVTPLLAKIIIFEGWVGRTAGITLVAERAPPTVPPRMKLPTVAIWLGVLLPFFLVGNVPVGRSWTDSSGAGHIGI